jgi:uncharacterized protein YndB with AHSA1/START domain
VVGPEGFTCPVADLDVRPGGASLVIMPAPVELGMADICNTWTYERVAPFRRLEFVSRFSTADRASIDPRQAGIPADGIRAEVPTWSSPRRSMLVAAV